MKKIQKIALIFLIFIIIQLITTMFLTSKVSAAESWIGDIFDKGKNFEEMGAENAKSIEENEAKETFDALKALFRLLKIIGYVVFMVEFAFIGVSLFMNFENVSAKIAEAKTTLIFVTIVAVLFVFSEQILTWIVNLFS